MCALGASEGGAMVEAIESDPEVILLGALALRAARRAMGKPEQIEQDGLGAMRMRFWCGLVRRWLGGDEDAAGYPAARLAVLDAATMLRKSLRLP
jgi:hypothetical protein